MALRLESKAFANGGRIPAEYTCQGEGLSPPLRWEGVPENTASLALIMEDPDSTGGTMTHWVLFDVPPTAAELLEGEKAVGKQGRNGFASNGYKGPCPPEDHGEHHYRFILKALDVPSLNLETGADRSEIEAAMRGHVIEAAELVGTYEKPRGE
jgi:hypothetical protein